MTNKKEIQILEYIRSFGGIKEKGKKDKENKDKGYLVGQKGIGVNGQTYIFLALIS